MSDFAFADADPHHVPAATEPEEPAAPEQPPQPDPGEQTPQESEQAPAETITDPAELQRIADETRALIERELEAAKASPPAPRDAPPPVVITRETPADVLKSAVQTNDAPAGTLAQAQQVVADLGVTLKSEAPREELGEIAPVPELPTGAPPLVEIVRANLLAPGLAVVEIVDVNGARSSFTVDAKTAHLWSSDLLKLSAELRRPRELITPAPLSFT